MFLRDYWYVAASDQEVQDKPLGRMILGEPVVLFRTEDGEISAMEVLCDLPNPAVSSWSRKG